MPTLRLAPFESRYVEAVMAIDRESQSSSWSEEAFRTELDRPEGVFLVALSDGEPVGFAGAWVVIDEIHITNVAVLPNHRRQGIARRLIDQLMEQCREQGGRIATLEVRAGNEAAIALYESFGFKSVGRRRGYYPDNKEDALVMWSEPLDDSGD